MKNAILTMSVMAIGFCGLLYGETPKSKAYIRGDGTMMINGKSFFPIGVRTEKVEDIPEIAKSGFNFVMGSGEWGPKHYKVAAANDLYIMAGHYVWAAFRGTQANIDLRAREGAAVNSFLKNANDQSGRTLPQALKAFDDLPGVVAWKIGDEPEAKLTELVEIAYEVIKSYNPNRVVGPLLCDRQWFGNYRNAGDLVMVDNYPLRGDHYPVEKKWATSVNETYKRVCLAAKAFKGKAVWYIAPMYPGNYYSGVREDDMNLQDQRLPVYAGLIAGAKGIIFYHWGLLSENFYHANGLKKEQASAKTRAQRLDIMKELAKELQKLGPIISDGRPNDEVDIRWFNPGKYGPGPQIYRLIEYQGKQYLFIMNLLDVPVEGAILGPDPAHNANAYSAEVFVGKEYLSVDSKKIPGGKPAIKIAPRGAGVFVLTRNSIIKK